MYGAEFKNHFILEEKDPSFSFFMKDLELWMMKSYATIRVISKVNKVWIER